MILRVPLEGPNPRLRTTALNELRTDTVQLSYLSKSQCFSFALNVTGLEFNSTGAIRMNKVTCTVPDVLFT